MSLSEMASRFRKPEYTGENRCRPCTVVNVGLAVVVAAVVAVLTVPWAGVVTLGGSGLLIYLRGYLVPGTPGLTERYFPPWLLQAFGKEPVVVTGVSGSGRTDGSTGRPLVDSGVLTGEGDAPALSTAFRTAWWERTVAVLEGGVDCDAVARTFGAGEASRLDEMSFVLDGTRSVRWGSSAALAADVAAATVLDERLQSWTGFDHGRRRETLKGLRFLLDRCPACEAPLTVEQERVDPCCQKPHLVAESACETCGAAVADAAVVDIGDVDSVPAALLEK